MMARSYLLTAAIMLAATAATTEQQAHGLAGTFACVTRDTNRTVWRFTTLNEPFGAWLRLRASFPPQNGLPARSAYTYLGYDAGGNRWNIVSLSSAGTYYTRYSTSRSLNGSHWIDDHPADGGTALLEVPTSSEYIFNFSSPRDSSITTCARE
jgi:hypothetical protein